jgi:hypothetical protein
MASERQQRGRQQRRSWPGRGTATRLFCRPCRDQLPGCRLRRGQTGRRLTEEAGGERLQQFRGVRVDPDCPGAAELSLAGAAAQQTDARNTGPPAGFRIPDGVAHEHRSLRAGASLPMMLGAASGITWFPEISSALAVALSIPPVSKDTVGFSRCYPVGILWVTTITDVAERPGRGGGARADRSHTVMHTPAAEAVDWSSGPRRPGRPRRNP